MDFDFVSLDISNEDEFDWFYDFLSRERPHNILPPDKKSIREYLEQTLVVRFKIMVDDDLVGFASFSGEAPGTLAVTIVKEYREVYSGKDILKDIRSREDVPDFVQFDIWDTANIPMYNFRGDTVCKNKSLGLKVPSISGRCYCCSYLSQKDGSIILMADDCLVMDDCDC